MTEEAEPALRPEPDPEEPSPEAVPEGSAAPESGGALDGGVEGEEGQEAEQDEELDDKGVPIKNRLAEMERKNRELEERYEKLSQRLEEKNKNKEEKDQEDPAKIFDSLIEDVSDGEMEAAGFSLEHIKVLRRAIAAGSQQTTISAVKKADRERRELVQMRQKVAQKRNAAVTEVSKEMGDEFGTLIVEKGEGWDWNRNSELFKRSSEIYVQDPRLRNSPDGEAIAARKAFMELYREKYGKKPPPDSKLKKSQRMLGKGGSGKSAGPDIKNSDGEFYRELKWKEVSTLSPEEQAKYLTLSVEKGWNKEE